MFRLYYLSSKYADGSARFIETKATDVDQAILEASIRLAKLYPGCQIGIIAKTPKGTFWHYFKAGVAK